MPNRQTAARHRLFKGKRAPDQETDGIGCPEIRDIGRFSRQNAIPENPIARQIEPKIRTRRHKTGLRIARLGDIDDGTGFWITLAEEEELKSKRPRQDDEVPLHMSRRLPRRRTDEPTIPAGQTDLAWVGPNLVGTPDRASGSTRCFDLYHRIPAPLLFHFTITDVPRRQWKRRWGFLVNKD